MLAAETPFSILTVVLALLVLMGMVGLVLFLNWSDRQALKVPVDRGPGGLVISLLPREGPIWVRILNQQSITHWDVIYVTTRWGSRRRAVCKAMFLRCFVESDEAVDEPGHDAAGQRKL